MPDQRLAGPIGAGRELIAQLQVDRTRRWEPILLLQGFGVFPPAAEDLAFRLPGPKVCVGSWLASRVRSSGVSADDVVHIPNGVDPGTFRISTPIEGRAPHAAMNFDPHPAKAGYVGLDALTRLHAAAGVPSTVFGTITPMPPVGAGLRFVASPSQPVIARSIYNEASLFLQPSVREGFGMCAVESMACGCALVTTDNGGSQDYAFDGETALVCGNEPADMADSLARLAADEALRLRIATNGSRFVDRFRWTASAGRLRELMEASRDVVARFAGTVDANQIWLWGQGRRPRIPSFADTYGLQAGLVSAVDLVRGLGALTGIRVAQVEGITGWYDTSYEAKRDACLDSLAAGDDLFLIHVEASDEAGHAGNVEEKVKALENWDRRILGPLVDALDMDDFRPWRLLLLPDHATPLALRTHTSDSVPYLLVDSEVDGPGGVYTEAGTAGCPPVPAHTLMNRLITGSP